MTMPRASLRTSGVLGVNKIKARHNSIPEVFVSVDDVFAYFIYVKLDGTFDRLCRGVQLAGDWSPVYDVSSTVLFCQCLEFGTTRCFLTALSSCPNVYL